MCRVVLIFEEVLRTDINKSKFSKENLSLERETENADLHTIKFCFPFLISCSYAFTFIFRIDSVSSPNYQIILTWKRFSFLSGFHEMLTEERPVSSLRFV